MKAMYKITVGGKALSESLHTKSEIEHVKKDYEDDGYENVKVVKVDVLQEYYNMKEEIERNKFTDLEKEIISKGILLYEREWRKAIIKQNKDIKESGGIPAMGEDMPKIMNHDIFIKLDVMRNTYNDFITQLKIEG